MRQGFLRHGRWSFLAAIGFAAVAAFVLRPTRLEAQVPQKPAPNLTIGLTNADSISYTLQAPSFRALIPIEAKDSGEFLVVASPLTSEDGSTIALTYWLQSDTLGMAAAGVDQNRRRMKIAALDGVNLVLSADLPLPGSYRGTYSIITADARATRAYTVKWPRLKNPLELIGGGAVQVGVRSKHVPIPFALHDSTSSSVLIYAPTLDDLRQLKGADTSMAVPHGGGVVQNARTSAPITDTLRIRAGTSEQFELTIPHSLQEAGTYTATLRIAGPAFSSFTVPIKLYAREPWLCAAVIILLGIVLAEGVRQVREYLRPRLEQQRQAAAQLEALAKLEQDMALPTAINPDERTALNRIREGLTTVYQDSSLKGSGGNDAILADMERRLRVLPEWASLRRQIGALEPPELQADLQSTLNPVHGFLIDSGLAEEAAAKAAETILHDMPTMIDKALAAHLQARIKEFSDRVKQERAEHPSDDAFLKLIQETVQSRLTEAEEQAAKRNLTQARAAFEDARLRYVDLLVKELKLRLDQPRPSWLEDAEWARIQALVRSELTTLDTATGPEQRLALYERSQALYLRESARTLETVVQALLATNVPADEKEQLNKVRLKSRETQSRAAIPDLHGAHAAFQEAELAWAAYQELRKKAGVKQGTSPAVTVAAAPPGTVPPGLALPPARPALGSSVRFLSSRALGLRVQWLDRLISSAAALVAVLLGLSLLWAPDLTWGTSADKFAAFLWGLGLQQAGNEAFRGIADLVGRVGTGNTAVAP